jgi:hypothetical protein
VSRGRTVSASGKEPAGDVVVSGGLFLLGNASPPRREEMRGGLLPRTNGPRQRLTVTVFVMNSTGCPSMIPPMETVCVPGVSGVRYTAETM